MSYTEKEESCIKDLIRKTEITGDWESLRKEFTRFNSMECFNHEMYDLTKDEYRRCGMEALVRSES